MVYFSIVCSFISNLRILEFTYVVDFNNGTSINITLRIRHGGLAFIDYMEMAATMDANFR